MLPNEFRDSRERYAAVACETAWTAAVRDVKNGRAAGSQAVWGCLGPSRTRDKLWGGIAVEDMRQRRPALLTWLFQHVCPDAGLDAACPAEEEGEPRRIIGFLLHTHATILTGVKDETRGRQ